MEARQITAEIKIDLAYFKAIPAELISIICLMINDPAAIKLVMFVYLLQTQAKGVNRKFQHTWKQLSLLHYPKVTASLPSIPNYKQLALIDLKLDEEKKLFDYISDNNLKAIKTIKLSVDLLLKVKNKEGRNPIAHACFLKREAILKYFYQQGVNESRTNHYFNYDIGYRPIHWASACGLLDVVIVLYGQNMFCFSETTPNMERSLNVACEYGHFEIVKFITSTYKTSIDQYPKSPIGDAAYSGNLEILMFLIEQEGGSVNPNNALWKNIPIVAAVCGGHLPTIKYLVTKGANLHLSDTKAGSLMHCAAANDHGDVIKYLLENNIEADTTDCQGKTPFIVAIDYKHNNATKALLGNIEVNKTYLPFNNPLRIAIITNNLQLVKWLFEYNYKLDLNLNKRDELFWLAEAWNVTTPMVTFLRLWVAFKQNQNQPLFYQLKAILLTPLTRDYSFDQVKNLCPISIFQTTEKKLTHALNKCKNADEMKTILNKHKNKINPDRYDFIFQYILNDKKSIVEKSIVENTLQINMQKK